MILWNIIIKSVWNVTHNAHVILACLMTMQTAEYRAVIKKQPGVNAAIQHPVPIISLKTRNKKMITRVRSSIHAIRYYLYALRWLWRNQTWADTRQKFKALERDWKKHIRANA